MRSNDKVTSGILHAGSTHGVACTHSMCFGRAVGCVEKKGWQHVIDAIPSVMKGVNIRGAQGFRVASLMQSITTASSGIKHPDPQMVQHHRWAQGSTAMLGMGKVHN
jgi:hypothetical protein